MFESTPMYPDCGRYWDMVERHKITVFYTAPTAIRSLMRFGDDAPKKYDLSSLRVLGTVGEPINPAAWKWYHDVIGNGRCSVVDTYWQVCNVFAECNMTSTIHIILTVVRVPSSPPTFVYRPLYG
jgi:acetyl-CoA synthetase